MSNFTFAEYAVNGITKRNDIRDITKFNLDGIDNECYRSIFLFDENIKTYVDKTHSVTRYAGLHISDGLSFDFDGSDLTAVRLATIKFCLNLKYNFDLPLDFLRISFSGNKGFHVTIPFQAISETIQPKDNFYLIYKGIAEDLSNGFEFVDSSIYEARRLLRMLNTINAKSGLYKIPLLFNELANLDITIENILDAAKAPRQIDNLPLSEIVVVKPLKELYDKWNSHNFAKNEKTYAPNNNKGDEILNLIKSGADEGNRHLALIRLTGMFASKVFDYDFTLELLRHWNQINRPPLSEDRLETESLRAYQDCIKHQKQDETIPIYNLEKASEVYANYIAKIAKLKIVTGFKTIDNKLRGIMPGETMCILGKTSVGKSAFLQHIGLNSAKESQEPVLFYSMEMPITSVYERTCQIETGLSGYEIEDLYSQDAEEIKVKAKIIFNDLPNFFTITESGLSLEKIESLTKYAEANIYHKKTGLILIDYLGLIKEPGKNLYEQTSRVARGIKDLGKKLDCPIIFLSQVTKEYDVYDELEINAARDSGSVDEASDFILGLWKEDTKDEEYSKEITLNLGILKNRKGGRGKIQINMEKRSLRVTELIFEQVGYQQI
jgi:replicative DNA helicase